MNESARAALRLPADSGSVSARSFPIGQGTMDGTSSRSNTALNFRSGMMGVPEGAEAARGYRAGRLPTTALWS